jgi:hypothetical protein
MSTPSIPNEWLCPITLSILRDPVIAADGHTYERSEMEKWIAAAGSRPARSPKTNEVLQSYQLLPNHALRNTIHDFLQKYPLALRASAGGMASVPGFQDSPLTLSVANCVKEGASYLEIAVEAEGQAQRQPIVLIAIVDHSGSMGELAEPEDVAESYGYTRQDLVGHGLNTLAAILGPDDMLAIVKFSTGASVVMRPTLMNEQGKAAVRAAVDSIKPDSQTNIFEGCRLANEIANQDDMTGRHIVGLLLTDGFPNVNPPRGIVQTLNGLPRKNPWSLSTFGFGYNLDSKLLNELASWGNGVFGFIPDCTMVGTVLINFLANMLATASLEAVVKFDDTEYHIQKVQYGQARRFLLLEDRGASGVKSATMNGKTYEIVSKEVDIFAYVHHSYCLSIVTAVHHAENKRFDEAVNTMTSFYEANKDNSNEKVKALLRDVQSSVESEGQVTLALNSKYYNKWGAHYLRCYLNAHHYQFCMNFKDPGLQIYGGQLFHDIQDIGDKAFTTLAPPVPSRSKPAEGLLAASMNYGSNSVSFAPYVAAPTSMASWHNQSGGCFHGDCRIRMKDGSLRKISEVKAGEYVATPEGYFPVTAVVVCGSQLPSQPMVQLENLSITPWHPVRIAGEWKFPAELAPYTSRPVKTVYNLVLPAIHIVYVEGYQCCTLGHGYKGKVIEHPFFGTDAVIQSLQKIAGWAEGRPTFVNLTAVRNPVNGQICDWIDSPLV